MWKLIYSKKKYFINALVGEMKWKTEKFHKLNLKFLISLCMHENHNNRATQVSMKNFIMKLFSRSLFLFLFFFWKFNLNFYFFDCQNVILHVSFSLSLAFISFHSSINNQKWNFSSSMNLFTLTRLSLSVSIII